MGFIYNAYVYYNAHMNVLEKIQQMQNDRGWSTYKLAYEAGLTQSTLSNMFARKTCPTVETLEKLCEAFGITLSEFFETDENKISLSKNELSFIRKYRTLSEKEKRSVITLIESLSVK